MRLDQALITDLRTALRSRPVLLFLGLQAAAAVVFVARRGAETVSTVLLVWLAVLMVGFLAWWSGRHRLAHPAPDPVSAARARSAFALIGVSGMIMMSAQSSLAAGIVLFSVGIVLFSVGIGGWLWAAWRSGGWSGLRDRLLRDPRPFVPLMLLIAVPRLVLGGPSFVVALVLALPSGVGQQLLYLLGLYAPLEAVRRRVDVVAVGSAMVFGLLHVPFVLEANGGDLLASLANVVLFQASVGLVACIAFVRHRAAVPIGVVHALAIA